MRSGRFGDEPPAVSVSQSAGSATARCKSQERCSSDLPWRLVVAEAISDSKGGRTVTLHRNARTCPRSRRLLVDRVLEQGWSLAAAAEAAGVSERTAWKWVERFRRE